MKYINKYISRLAQCPPCAVPLAEVVPLGYHSAVGSSLLDWGGGGGGGENEGRRLQARDFIGEIFFKFRVSEVIFQIRL